MKKVFYIEKESFLRKMFELAFENEGEGSEVYTTGGTDSLFQVKEMGSEVLLIDIETLLPVKDKFLKELEESKYCSEIPVLAVGFEAKLELVAGEKWYSGVIKKPISALNLLETIQNSVVK